MFSAFFFAKESRKHLDVAAPSDSEGKLGCGQKVSASPKRGCLYRGKRGETILLFDHTQLPVGYGHPGYKVNPG